MCGSFFPSIIEDFGLYISSGMATLDRNATVDFWSLARSARQQVMQAFDLNVLQAKAVAMSSIVANRPNPQTTYERIGRSFGYNAVLTNHGKFPNMSELKRFRVTAAYPILSSELEPVVAVASVNRRAYITVGSPSELVDYSSMFLNHLRQYCKPRKGNGRTKHRDSTGMRIPTTSAGNIRGLSFKAVTRISRGISAFVASQALSVHLRILNPALADAAGLADTICTRLLSETRQVRLLHPSPGGRKKEAA